jgi:ferredoxin-NADP reductase
VTGFTGPYTLGPDAAAQTDHVVHICAGSGSVPNYSMLKYALEHLPTVRHTFVYSNKTWDDVIYREALAALAAQHPDRLKVVHTLTREENPTVFGPTVRRGRISGALLKEVMPDPAAPLVYVCGPGISKWDIEEAKKAGTTPQPRFLESVLAELNTLGVPKSRIKREFYG